MCRGFWRLAGVGACLCVLVTQGASGQERGASGSLGAGVDQSAAEAFGAGMRALLDGDTEAARAAFVETARLAPTSAAGYWGQAMCAVDLVQARADVAAVRTALAGRRRTARTTT